NRLQMVGGVRKTESRVTGYMPLTDSKWNYVKLPNGTLYMDSVYNTGVKFDGSNFTNASGQTVRDVILTDTALQTRMKAAGAFYPDHLILGPGGANGTTANSLEATQLQFRTRPVDTKTNNPITPSISLSYAI